MIPIHGLINYKDTKTKYRHQKKLTCTGTLRQALIRVYKLEILYSQSCCYFRPSFVNYCPSNFQIHGLINYKDIKTKYRHQKKLTCTGTLRQALIRVYKLEILYSQSCCYFRPSFVNYCPSNFLSGSPPPPLSCVKVQYILKVSG